MNEGVEPACVDWRQRLAESRRANEDGPTRRYVQLATVDEDGCGRCRTVLFRELLDDPPRLMFVTHCQSPKARQMRENPWGEACWYFRATLEQFRFLGRYEPLGADCADAQRPFRRQVWEQMPEKGRKLFYWPAPGELRTPETNFEPQGDMATPPASFCIVLLEVVRVDWLDLRPWPHERVIYDRNDDGQWRARSVVA